MLAPILVLFVAVLLACAPGCSDAPAPAPPPACPNVEVLVAASDYSSSVVCGAPEWCKPGSDLGKDPQLSLSRDRVFFLARDNDLVFELDPTCGTPLARTSVHVDETKTANPHDVAAAPDGSLWVPLYNLGRIVVVAGGRADGPSIDLSGYDADGNPDAESIRIVDVGGAAKAFVALERLTFDPATRRMTSSQPSEMLRIDVATRTVEAAIPLSGRNPFNPMSEDGGALFFAEPGSFDAADEEVAGIERFDVATSTTRLLVRERALGGSVAEVTVSRGCGAAIVAGPERDVNPTSVVTFDATSGVTSRPVLGPTPGYDLQGLAFRGDVLYVGDRRSSGSGFRVHVLERTGDSCDVRDTGRTLELPQRPVALRPARRGAP